MTSLLEAPVLEDLDLLDDDGLEHGVCIHCYPNLKAMEPFIATCGKKVVDRTGVILDYIPPNACPACVAEHNKDPICKRCGK